MTLGEVGNVIAEGVVENAAWDWSAAGVNAPLYVDGSGVLTTVKPTIPTIVAAVIDRTKILIRPSSLFADSSSDPATTTVAGVVTLSVAPVSATIPIAVGNNDTRLTNARAPTAHTHPTTDILPGTLSGMALQTFSEVTTAPLITAGALVLNIAGGNIFNVALNANVTTLTFSGVPVAHTTLITLALTADGTPRVVTWPASVKWPLGIAPTLTSAAGKIDILTFVTFNQGVSWLAAVAGQGY